MRVVSKANTYQKTELFSTQFDCLEESCDSALVYSILLTKYGVISYRLKTNLLIESGGGKRPCEATATGHYDARC
jgi:hypothetical protein